MNRTPLFACTGLLVILVACLCLRKGTETAGYSPEKIERRDTGQPGAGREQLPGTATDAGPIAGSRAAGLESRSSRRRLPQPVVLGRVSATYLGDLAKRPAGEVFELSLGGARYQAEMESWTDDGQVSSFAVRLNEPEGRFQGTLRRDGKLNAEVLFNGKEAALSLSGMAEAGGWELRPTILSDLMCVPRGTRYGTPGAAALDPTPPPPPAKVARGALEAPPLLNSLPGAAYVIYCDFDGETVTHVKWNSGQTIDAQPHPNANDAVFVTRVWKRAAEDFAPFAINVTTERAVFDATPVARRVHCIITPTTTANPGSGGVAYLRSFGDGTPCWTFNQSEFSCADTISHEVGHTLGLSHDGRAGGDVYYGGHGTGATSWAPIMGAAWSDESASYTEYVTQWSKGEYTSANNTQDDLEIIVSENGFTYRTDDKGSTRAAATALVFSNGTVSDSGVIERTTDEDWLRFTTSGGTVSFQVNVLNVQSSSYPQPGANLAVSLQLVDSAGTARQSSNPAATMGASVSATLEAGTYYLRIEGTARGTAAAGFTDYGSLGQYTVAGTVPQIGVNMLAITPPEVSVPAAGGTFTFEVSSNVGWNWTESESWISSGEATSQTGNQTFTYVVAANTDSARRSATFTVTGGSLDATHTITQDGSTNDDHGNAIGSATLVSPSSSTSGNIEVSGDQDYFRINVASTGVLLVNTTGSTDTYGYLLDSSGNELASDDDGGADANFQISRTVAPGTYYVRVGHYSATGTGNYVMISIISPTVGLNVSPASASLGREASTGSFNVTSNASWSWSSSASWVLAGEPATQSGNQLFEYSVASNTGSGSRTATITLTAGAATATHTITQVGAGGDDHGNSIATATAISPNSTTSGTIGFPGDNDYFRIVVSGPGTLVVRSTGSTDTYGYLLNSSGVLLASDDDSYGTNFEVGITVPAAGTYYVRVRHYGGSDTGAYQLVSSWAATLVSEISVEYPSGTNLVSGVAIVEFGTLALGADVTRTFTVRNPGTGPLTGIAPSFLGGNAPDFAVTTSPASSVVAGGFTSFTIRLAPSVIGRRATTLRVASNDANENPFDIWLTGEVATPRQMFDGVAASSGLTGSNALPAAVPYGDGVKNLIKYAFNMSLGSSGYRTLSAGTGTSGLPSVVLEGSGASRMIKVEYLRRKGSGLIYQPKRSTSLVAGTFVPMTGTPVVTSIDVQWERVVIRDPATDGRIFAMVDVTIP